MNPLQQKESGFTFFKLHFIVIILGFSAIFGKLIQLDAMNLVFFRTLVGSVFLAGWLIISGKKHILNTQALKGGILVGILLAAHWITFFHAIKVSNVSVTLGCLGSSTLFAAFFEPFTHKKKVRFIDVVAGITIIIGIYLIFRFEFRYVEGIIYSVISALLAAMFSVFNKHLTYKFDHRSISLTEITTACLITLGVLLISGVSPVQTVFTMSGNDILFLILLGSIGTAYAYTETISVIKRLNAYAVILAINLEPVYGILLARWIFGETELMTGGFYAGAGIILLTVILYSVFTGKQNQPKNLIY